MAIRNFDRRVHDDEAAQDQTDDFMAFNHEINARKIKFYDFLVISIRCSSGQWYDIKNNAI